MFKRLLQSLALAAFLFLSFHVKSQSNYNNEIKQAAISFVNSLDKMHRQVALLDFKDTARLKWNNLPVGLRARAGISVGNMTEVQT
jgi:flagellar hook-associated protein FlgK